MRPLLYALVIGVLASAAFPEDLLLDSARDVTAWHANNGSEFPGATAEIVTSEDSQRGRCLKGEFQFAGDSRYCGLHWYGRIPKADAIGFSVKLDDRERGMLRVRDATDQEHLGHFQADRGRWTDVRVPLKQDSFPNYWSGAGDGKLHFPLKRVLIAAPRGPDRQQMPVSNLYAVVDDVQPQRRWHIKFQPSMPSGIALPDEKAQYTVTIANAVKQPAENGLRITSRAPAGDRNELIHRQVKVGGWQRLQLNLDLPTEDIGYTRLRAELRDKDGNVVSEGVSAIAVVPHPRHYGEAAPDCFFGIQHVSDMEAAERIGAKTMRDAPGWRWAEPEKGRIRWHEYLRPRMQKVRDHNMSLLFTAQAKAPDWIRWDNPDHPQCKELPAPDRLHEWQRFVRQVVGRYGDDITALEVQNEPNLTCWRHPGLNFQRGVEYYVKLLRAAAAGAKAADPDITIAGIDVSGGDFNRSLRFTEAVLNRAADQIDLFTGHTYPELFMT